MRVTGGWVFTFSLCFKCRTLGRHVFRNFPSTHGLLWRLGCNKNRIPVFFLLYRGVLRSPAASQGPSFAGRRKSARPAPPPGDPRPPEPRANRLRLPRHGGILGKSAAGASFFIGVSNVNLRPQPWKTPCSAWHHGISTMILRPIWPTNCLLKHGKL